MKFKSFKRKLSDILNNILKYSNPIAASLSKREEFDVRSIKSWTHECKISTRAKLYPTYRLAKVSVDDYTYISENAKISITSIGKFCSIGPNFLCGWGIHPISGLSTSPMFYSTMKQNGCSLTSENKISERKSISIGNDVFIGMNVTILDGVTVGHGAVIGAGAVVNKDIPPYAIAVGCPAKVTKYRFDEDVISLLLKISWWDLPESRLQLVEQNFWDVNGFIEIMKQEHL